MNFEFNLVFILFFLNISQLKAYNMSRESDLTINNHGMETNLEILDSDNQTKSKKFLDKQYACKRLIYLIILLIILTILVVARWTLKFNTFHSEFDRNSSNITSFNVTRLIL